MSSKYKVTRKRERGGGGIYFERWDWGELGHPLVGYTVTSNI